jgi:hypothetical protein
VGRIYSRERPEDFAARQRARAIAARRALAAGDIGPRLPPPPAGRVDDLAV